MSFTLLDETRAVAVDAAVGPDAVRLPPDAVRSALGWELKPQGLCRGDVCMPIAPSSSLVSAEGVDLQALASLLGRPLALDAEHRAACLGVAAADRARDLRSLEAPDFSLPDLDGRTHTLSGFRGKKILLVAWASW